MLSRLLAAGNPRDEGRSYRCRPSSDVFPIQGPNLSKESDVLQMSEGRICLRPPSLFLQRRAKGGGNSGEGRTYHKAPPQKEGGHLKVGFPCTFPNEKSHLGVWASAKVREKQRGGTQGSGKHTIRPSPKTVLDPPTHDTISPPPLCSRNVILLTGNWHRPDKSHFLRPPKLGLEVGTL